MIPTLSIWLWAAGARTSGRGALAGVSSWPAHPSSRQGVDPMPTDIALTALALPLSEFPGIAREAEQRGYRTAWVGEASGAEAIVLSTLIATHTQALKIANGVIPVQTRTPIVYGQAAATLGHLAPGRFALGLGLSSEIIVGQWHGLPFTPSIQQMREAVQIIRMTAVRETLARDITGYAIVSVSARFFEECGFAEEVEAVNRAWKAGDRAGAVKEISERVLEGLGAVGSAEACRAQMAAFARTGATPVVLPFAPPGPAARASLLRTFRAFPA